MENIPKDLLPPKYDILLLSLVISKMWLSGSIIQDIVSFQNIDVSLGLFAVGGFVMDKIENYVNIFNDCV